MNFRSVLLCLVCAVTQLACADPDSPVAAEHKTVVLGSISTLGGQPAITVPAAARAGVPFVVAIVTRLPMCSTKGFTMVDVVDSRADVAAFDTIIVPPRGTVCPDGINDFQHAAPVTLQRPGESVVVVRGLRPGSPRDTIRYSFNVTVTN